VCCLGLSSGNLLKKTKQDTQFHTLPPTETAPRSICSSITALAARRRREEKVERGDWGSWHCRAGEAIAAHPMHRRRWRCCLIVLRKVLQVTSMVRHLTEMILVKTFDLFTRLGFGCRLWCYLLRLTYVLFIALD
jgi:hypothetical protein